MTAQSYAFPVGQFLCAVVCDGAFAINEERLQGRYPDVAAADLRQTWTDLGHTIDHIPWSYNCLVVRTAEETILFDAGSGVGTKPLTGHLLESMAQVGIEPNDVTIVVITHAHGDHIAGIATNTAPTFANARYVISQPEWDYWTERITAAPEDMAWLKRSFDLMTEHSLTKVGLGDEIVPGIETLPAIGHSMGQMAIRISSDGETLLHLADILHCEIQFRQPEWSVKFDTDTALSVPTRQQLLGMAADESLFTLLYHLPFPGLGRVHRTDEGAFRWQALDLDHA
jgi:glyoxylase-like metal-dependent hydrolase (beta-lactamase superfamily II)